MASSWLREWIGEPRPGRGVHLAEDDGTWQYHGYDELAAAARRTAGALVTEGVRPGDVVCVILPTDFTCLATYFGVWAAGATMCLVTPPMFQTGAEYVDHVAAILRQARPRLTVASGDLAGVAAEAMAQAGVEGKPWEPREAEPIAMVEAGELALLQFTSGSSGDPKGVRVSWANLEANIGMIARMIGLADGDGVASWLPLYHDMGLIGCLLTTVACQNDLWLMRPDQFIRDPLRWLTCLGHAKHTAAPPFAYAYTARRVKAADLEGLDLSGWRTALVGAEPIDPHALESFAELTGPAGFRREAYHPAYGMAETTLAVTFDNARVEPLCVRPDPDALEFGKPVRIELERRLGPESLGDKAGWVVGCGAPDAEMDVTICDDSGTPLPDGYLGEIVVAGASVCDGYHAGRESASTRFADGAVHTGDAGFFHEGRLFVLGRMGDSIKVRGRNIYVEDLEARLAAATGLSRGRITLVSIPGVGTRGVALFAETAEGPWVTDARQVLRRRLGDDARISIVVGQNLIHRTSSGKARRRYMWELLNADRLEDARILAD